MGSEPVLSEKLGNMKHHEATLHVPASANPMSNRARCWLLLLVQMRWDSCKARPIPFALKEAASKELDCLEQAGIVKKVVWSDWAAPVVLMPKQDGSICLVETTK